MKFLRIAMLYFDDLPEQWRSFEVTLGKVAVATIPVGRAPKVDRKKRVLLRAETTLAALPSRDSDGFIIIPTDARRTCETAIELLANLIAVTGRTCRSISSATPSAAFVPESDQELAFLAESAGVQVALQWKMGASYHIQPSNELLSGLADRQDGVALMAEALSHGQAIAKYRDLIRVFELAFALPVSRMEKKVAQFLAGSGLGYERPEIASWLSMRNPASHGDKTKTQVVALDTDYRPFIARMEQAAIDILFNKDGWHSNSKTRRSLLKPLATTTSPSGDLSILQGSSVTLECQLFDEFGVYPLDLNGIIGSPPGEWWWKPRKHEPLVVDESKPEKKA